MGLLITVGIIVLIVSIVFGIADKEADIGIMTFCILCVFSCVIFGIPIILCSQNAMDKNKIVTEYFLLYTNYKVVKSDGHTNIYVFEKNKEPEKVDYEINFDLDKSKYVVESKKVDNSFFTIYDEKIKRHIELSISDINSLKGLE
jgi:hypothetical protein